MEKGFDDYDTYPEKGFKSPPGNEGQAMKSLGIVLTYLTNPSRRRNLLALVQLLLLFWIIVAVFSVVFHYLMEYEGQQHSWIAGVYWVLVVMSTLGFGDITFKSDPGRLFSIVVLLTGTVFMLVLLPFTFIQFFYVPWMEARAAARAPRELPDNTRGHVILTGLSAVERSLIRMLQQAEIAYVVLVSEVTEALRLDDEGIAVMLGEMDDPATYRQARVEQAAMVVAMHRDTTNTNIAFTVQEISTQTVIAATASASASIDILVLAGCDHVLQLGEMLGKALARRVLGRDAKAHIVGAFGDLLIAEAATAGTPLVGRTLQEIHLAQQARVTVVGVWNRGAFSLAGPESRIDATSVLLLAGTQADLDEYNALFGIYGLADSHVLILGGGRVGRATADALVGNGKDYRLVELNPQRVRDPERTILGDAAELEVLEQAGIHECVSVVITTRDDDVNIYLTIYCRKLRPDVQIFARANQDRNVSTLHRAGADFVLSYASIGASQLFNLLRHNSLLSLADGLSVFRVPMPAALVGQSLASSRFRQRTGCNVVAIYRDGKYDAHPAPETPLPADAELVLVGDAAAERKYYDVLG
jgi:Trk K+ transport system NAD-binding subunit